MKRPPRKSLLCAGAFATVLSCACSSLFAADATWNLNADGTWVTGTNWNPTTAPGTTSGTTSPDIATFGTVITGSRAITVDANRNVAGITFAGNSSAYGLTGGSLLLTNGGTIQTTGAGSGHTDSIASTITLQGDGGGYTFNAGSATSTRLLVISGGVTGVSTAGNTTALTLTGSNTGGNAVSGSIGDGSDGGKLAIVKSGTGSWTLSGSNSFTGGTTINSGQLTAGHLNAFGNTAGVGSRKIAVGDSVGGLSATLRSTVDLTNANEITVVSGGTGTVTLSMANTAGTDHLNNASIVLGTGTMGKGVTITSSSDLNGWSGVVSDGASVTAGNEGVVTILGTTGKGTYFGNAASTYKGGTVINGATSANSVAIAASGTVFGTGSVTINGGSFGQFGNATVGGYSQLILNNSLILSNQFGRTLALNGAAGSTVNLGATGTDSSRIINSTVGAALTIGGIMQDGTNGVTKGITKNGTGDVILTAANTYTGTTVINGGRIVLGGTNNRLPTASDVIINGGALEMSARNQIIGALSGSSSATIANSQTGTSTLTVSSAANSTFDGRLVTTSTNSTSRLNLVKDSNGTLTMNGSQSFSGGTTINAGTLIVNGGLSSASAQSLSSTVANNSNTLTVASTAGMVVGQIVSGGGLSAGTYITAINSGTSVTLNQLLVTGSTATRTFNAYAGSGLGSGAVTVGINGTLGGNGVIAPTGTNGISVAGTLAPGASIGNLTIDLTNGSGVVTMAGSGSFKFELGAGNGLITSIAANSSDLLSLSGASTGDFTFASNNVDFLGTGGLGYYKLFDTSLDASTWIGLTFDGTTGLVTGGLSYSNLGGSFTGDFIVGTAANGGDLGDIYFNVVPEPSATALIFGAGVSVLLFRRKRRI